MTNFLHEKYGIEVSCSHVSKDSYEAKNLIATHRKNSFFTKETGFLVEHFIKPPICVNFSFPFPVSIASIELGLSVGAQTTDGIDILVTDEPKSYCSLRVVYHQCPIRDDSLKIMNGSYNSKAPFQLSQKDSMLPENISKNLFKFSHLLSNVRIVQVRITKTKGSSVPALGSVKIFGAPGSRCSLLKWNKILHLCNKQFTQPDEVEEVQILSVSDSQIPSEKDSKPNVDIPEEFLDPLTQEVMVLPMLLPSGHTVDQSTVEKMTNSQASWGRLPCDPFTGIPFGVGRKPISNTPLKARIDAFLVKNGSLDAQFAYFPRTVGRKLKDVPINGNAASSGLIFLDNSSEIAVNRSSNSEQAVMSGDSGNYATHESSHEITLQNSLSTALKTFYSTPGSSRKQDVLKSKDLCASCKDKSSLSHYKLPCQHKLCRKCLHTSQNTCSYCHKPFAKKEVHKTFSIL